MHAQTRVRTYARTLTCMHALAHTYAHALGMHACTHVQARTGTHARMRTHMHVRAHAHAHTHTQARLARSSMDGWHLSDRSDREHAR